MIQCANLMLGLDETAGLTTDRSLPMSVTAAEGFVAAGCHAGIKRRKFDMAMIATDDRQPVPCAAVFTQNKFAAPPVELDRATLAGERRPGRGGDRQFGQRQCRDRRSRATRTRS